MLYDVHMHLISLKYISRLLCRVVTWKIRHICITRKRYSTKLCTNFKVMLENKNIQNTDNSKPKQKNKKRKKRKKEKNSRIKSIRCYFNFCRISSCASRRWKQSSYHIQTGLIQDLLFTSRWYIIPKQI